MDEGCRVVSPKQAAAELYPFVYVNDDGTVRELHAAEREYLETPFQPYDSSRPAVKSNYESEVAFGSISGFCRRADLPRGIEVAGAPSENPFPHQTLGGFVDLRRERHEPHQAQESEKARVVVDGPSPLWPRRIVRSADQAEESPSSRRQRKIWLGGFGTAALIALRIAANYPQIKDRQPPPVAKPDQAERRVGGLSAEALSVTTQDVMRRVNEQGVARIVASQRRLGISDETLDVVLKWGWRAQNPEGQPPWESAAGSGTDWRTSVSWNVESVEKVLERIAARNKAASVP